MTLSQKETKSPLLVWLHLQLLKMGRASSVLKDDIRKSIYVIILLKWWISQLKLGPTLYSDEIDFYNKLPPSLSFLKTASREWGRNQIWSSWFVSLPPLAHTIQLLWNWTQIKIQTCKAQGCVCHEDLKLSLTSIVNRLDSGASDWEAIAYKIPQFPSRFPLSYNFPDCHHPSTPLRSQGGGHCTSLWQITAI